MIHTKIAGCVPLAFLAAVLEGCTLMPSYQRPAASVPNHYADLEHSTGAAIAQPSAGVVDGSWQGFVADARLKQLIELALFNNRDLQVAVLNVERSRAQYRITRAASVPGVSASGGFSRQQAAGVVADQWSASVGVTAWELDLFGRVRSLNAQALEQYFATVEAQHGVQVALVAQVATQYFALREAAKQLLLAQQTLQSVQESYDLNKATNEAGASNELDLSIAEGQVDSALVNVLTYRRSRAQAENALVLLVGAPLPAESPDATATADSAPLVEIQAGLPSELLQRRPDIMEAEHSLRAANASIGAARAAFFPTISLTGSIGNASTELSDLFSAGSSNWNFSPRVSVPLFAGGANRANLDSARVGERIALASYEKTIQTAFREVSDALAGSATYSQQIELEDQLIKAQSRRFELANLRYRQGEDSYLNVLSAQQDLYNAQQSLLQAQYSQRANQVALYQALGGGWK